MRIDALHRWARSVGAAAAIFGLFTMASVPPAAAAAEPYSEDVVKAAYLYRFAGYVDWPEQALAEAPFTIAVLGAPAIARELRRLLPGHPINHQIAQVREITSSRDLGNAQIVYVAAGHTELLRTLIPRASGPSVLLVTDEDGGLSSGSTLNFLTVDRNVRFEVSLTAARRWGLKISSELLGVAIRVQGQGAQSFLGCGPANGVDMTPGPCGPRLADQGSRKPMAYMAPDG
jgi:hypothetical protein